MEVIINIADVENSIRTFLGNKTLTLNIVKNPCEWTDTDMNEQIGWFDVTMTSEGPTYKCDKDEEDKEDEEEKEDEEDKEDEEEKEAEEAEEDEDYL